MVAGALGAFSAPGSQAWSPSGPFGLHFCLGSGRFGVALLLAPLLSPVLWSLGPLLGLGLLLLPWVTPGCAQAIGTNLCKKNHLMNALQALCGRLVLHVILLAVADGLL